MPSDAQAIPSEKIAPLCVFTPPVARRMASSAKSPGTRSASKHACASFPRCARPMRAQVSKYGLSAHALSMNVKTSMSRCAPALCLSTSPGLGVTATSKSSARWAFSAVRFANAASKCASMIAFAFSNSASALCARLLAQTGAGLPQSRQRRAGRPISVREILPPSGAITSISSSRPSASPSSSAQSRRLIDRASARTQSIASGPVFSWMAASNSVSHGASTAFTFRKPHENARSMFSVRLIAPAIFMHRHTTDAPGYRASSARCACARASLASIISDTVTRSAIALSSVLRFRPHFDLYFIRIMPAAQAARFSLSLFGVSWYNQAIQLI